MSWILIVINIYGGEPLTLVMRDQATCETAAEKIKITGARAVCIFDGMDFNE
jgi:hypothetical protein